jgi:anti-sigma regulatory factor (Ser/Thr protein kinase)/GAF domain-containing protein
VRVVPHGLRRRPDSTNETELVESAAIGTPAFRRRIALVAVLALVVIVAVSVGFAFRQYRERQRSALDDLRSRTIVAAAVVNAFFAGDIQTLEAAAKAPPVVSGGLPAMRAYLRRLESPPMRPFDGGIDWIDPTGAVRVSTAPGGSAAAPDVGSRKYVKLPLATGRPYVSGGLVTREPRLPGIVIAVPTRDAGGRISGVLAATIELRAVQAQRRELDLGYTGLALVDRNGRELLSGLAPVPNRSLLAHLERRRSTVVAGTHGLSGHGDDVVVSARATIPDWTIVIDRPRSAIFAGAWQSFLLQIVSVVGAALVVIVLVAVLVRHARREVELRAGRARAWTNLTRALSAAATPGQVADALAGSVAEAFPRALAVVVFEDAEAERGTATAASEPWPRLVASTHVLEEVAQRAVSGRESLWLTRTTPILGDVVALSGRRLRRLHCLPVRDDEGGAIGGIALLCPPDGTLDPGEWALLTSFAQEAAQALRRSGRSERDHRLSIRLQRNLLPDALPHVDGVALAGHYRAGSEGLEIGGDWYEAVRRPDGIVVLCVGDVIGRGVAAATLMGRRRDAFRAHAQETASPAEVVGRLQRHSSDDEMLVTVACVALDPYTGGLAYSRAGHPPPLLIDEVTGLVERLERAGAPPLGVAESGSIAEEQLTLSDRATVVLYSDGLIERRGRNIDVGIGVLAEAVASDPGGRIDDVIGRVFAALGPADDDVALLLARLTGEPMPFDVEVPARPAELATLRRRLRLWLTRRGASTEEVDDVVLGVGEACNNAIEHAYEDERGLLWLRVEDDGGRLRATVRDRGRWSERRVNGNRGRGIAIMESVMDVAEIERGEEGTTVVLERRLARGSGTRA